MNKKLLILFIFILVLIAGVFVLNFHNIGANFLWNLSNGGQWIFPLVTIGALIDSINLCAITILLLTVGFLFSVGQFHSAILKIGAAYIFGIFLVYVLIGLGILHTLYLFNTPHFMAKIGAFILILFGVITLIDEFFPAFPIKLKIPHFAHHRIAEQMMKVSLPGAFLLGGLVGLCAFPCVGGPYLMVLGLLHDATTYLKGFIYLIYYNLLFVLPLVIILIIGSNKTLYDKLENWQKQKTFKIKLISGLAMIALGIVILML